MVPRHPAIENMVLAVADNAVTCYHQSLYNAKPNCPPSATMTAHRAAWVCHWQSTGQAKSYSVDVGVQQGILCKSTELSTLFSGKTAILRQSPEFYPSTSRTASPPSTMGMGRPTLL